MERPLAEQQHAQRRKVATQRVDRSDQMAMPLAGNQLRDHPDHARVGLKTEFAQERRAVDRLEPWIRVDRAAHAADAFGRHSFGDQDVADALGYGNHAVEEAILDRHQPAQLRIVDPAREHAGRTRQPCGDAAPEICPAPTVQMHDCRSFASYRPCQSPRKRGIGIAAHRYLDHSRGASHLLADRRARRTGQDIGDSAPRQALDQPRYLACTTIEVPAGLDVQHLHFAAPSARPASSTTRSAVISRMHVQAPPQVGRLPHGEQPRPSHTTRAFARPVFV